jgi:predicted anti-sigma-YlaC factor YlaD
MKAMNCKNFRSRIPDALSGKIGGGDRVAFDMHLESCGVCKKEYTELKEIYEYLDVPDTKSADVIPIDDYCKPEKAPARRNWMRAALFFAVFLSAVTLCTQFRGIRDSFESVMSKRTATTATGEKVPENYRRVNHAEKTSETAAAYSDPYDGKTDSMLGSCYKNTDK